MHRAVIYVPETADDMKKDWFGEENINEYRWELSRDELTALNSGVLTYLNRLAEENKIHFGFNGLNEYEEDYICYQELLFNYDEIISGLRQFECKTEIQKLVSMIDKAVEYRTVICFCL